jgi:hypothetical protein
VSLPANVERHVRYGNGARPGASCHLEDGSLIVVEPHRHVVFAGMFAERDRVERWIVATRYHDHGESETVPLWKCPDDPDRWTLYWTCEA